MPTTRRYAIHPPYLVNRVRSEEPVDIQKTLNQVFGELHRWIRYIRDAGDQGQANFIGLDIDINNLKFLTVSSPPIGPGQSPYTVQPGDNILLVDALTGPVTILLPNALQNKGRLLTIKKIDRSGNLVTVNGAGALLDSDPDFDLELEDEVIEVVSSGTAYWII